METNVLISLGIYSQKFYLEKISPIFFHELSERLKSYCEGCIGTQNIRGTVKLCEKIRTYFFLFPWGKINEL